MCRTTILFQNPFKFYPFKMFSKFFYPLSIKGTHVVCSQVGFNLPYCHFSLIAFLLNWHFLTFLTEFIRTVSVLPLLLFLIEIVPTVPVFFTEIVRTFFNISYWNRPYCTGMSYWFFSCRRAPRCTSNARSWPRPWGTLAAPSRTTAKRPGTAWPSSRSYWTSTIFNFHPTFNLPTF